MTLHQRWQNTARQVQLVQTANSIWEEIQRQYTDEHRYYHTMEHLESMFRFKEQLVTTIPALNQTLSENLPYSTKEVSGLQLSDPAILEYAIWCHDLYYDPQRSDNEQRSAETACQWLQEAGVDPSRIEHCYTLILSTRHLQPETEAPYVQPDSMSEPLLHDLDLSVLGQELSVYQTYAANIRKEYAIYPDAVYQAGRVHVLHQFLDAPHIYQTKEGIARWEQQARENIHWEIAYLLK